MTDQDRLQARGALTELITEARARWAADVGLGDMIYKDRFAAYRDMIRYEVAAVVAHPELVAKAAGWDIETDGTSIAHPGQSRTVAYGPWRKRVEHGE